MRNAQQSLDRADVFYRRYADDRRLLPWLGVLVVLVLTGLLIAHDWLHGAGWTLAWFRAVL